MSRPKATLTAKEHHVIVARCSPSERPSIYGDQARPVARPHGDRWKRVSRCHPRAIDAVREFVTALEPALNKADDEAIRRHWSSFRRNHDVKVASTHELY